MIDRQPTQPKIVILLYLIAVCLAWAYILWVKAQPIINNAWFVLTPIIGYFYFTFAIISSIWMHYRKRLGLNIAYCVLMFGTAADVLSYSLVYNVNEWIAFTIVPLIAFNMIIVFYMAYYQRYFKGD